VRQKIPIGGKCRRRGDIREVESHLEGTPHQKDTCLIDCDNSFSMFLTQCDTSVWYLRETHATAPADDVHKNS